MSYPPRQLPPKAVSKGSGDKTVLIVVIVVAALSVVAFLCVVLGIALLLPAVQATRNATVKAANRAEAMNRAKQLAFAVHMHHDAQGKLPANRKSADGRVLHSWRTALLPYLEQQPLWQRIDQDQAWDAPSNAFLMSTDLEAFQSLRGDRGLTGITHFVAVAGPGTCFPADRPVAFRHIVDGVSNTIMFIEFPESTIPWAEPKDVSVDEAVEIIRNSTSPEGTIVVFADATVKLIDPQVDERELRKLFTVNDAD